MSHRHVTPYATALRLPVLAAALLAAPGCREDAQSPSPVEDATPAEVVSAVAPLSFALISAGGDHTCGVTTDNRAYCWGANLDGQLGDGTTTDRSWPTAVAGGMRFVQISAGYQHTCAVTPDDRAYCWGSNENGQIGDGTQYTNRLTPTALAAGSPHIRQVRAGGEHTCGLNPYNVAFCWGWNYRGQLGTNGGFYQLAPARVFGGLHFRRIITGGLHTCGATADDHAYCWGDNSYGEVGDGTHTERLRPAAVAGGLHFVQVLAGGNPFFGDEQEREPDNGFSCGVTADNLAYCWGQDYEGQLGIGTAGGNGPRLTPTPVAGGHHFRGIAPGNEHTCAVTPANVAWCWGNNRFGAIGDGTTTNRPAPVRVAGALQFSGLSTGVGGFHSCGVTTAGQAYCWGSNSSGQLGDGTRGTDRLKPVAVVGPS